MSSRPYLPALAAMLLLLCPCPTARGAEPEANLIVNGSFELLEKGRPVGWELLEGARNAAGSTVSDWSFDAAGHSGRRALRLSGDAATATWTMVRSDPVAVEPDRLLRLSGFMRTENVRREVRQWHASNIGLAFETAEGEPVDHDGYSVAGTPPMIGTRAWTRVERIVRVPEAASRVRAICFLSMSGTALFDDLGVERVVEPEWTVVETERFRFHEQEGARLNPSEREENERHLRELEALLGLRLPGKVQYHRHLDEEQKRRITGRGGKAHAELPYRVHTLRATDRHELVHLIAAVAGPPESVLLGEGLAVHLAGDHEGRPLDQVVRELAEAGRLPGLSSLADWASFAELEEDLSFPAAGSFVRFLIETGGLGAFKQLYPRHGHDSSPAVLDQRLLERYGATLSELEARWLAAVVGR